MKKNYSILSILMCLLFFTECVNVREKSTKPNVIVVLVDDAGYADFGFAGCKDLKTPNIDKLAENGVVFTDAHVSASVCGPSRAGIITGRYQQRFGFECNPDHNFTGVDLNEITIADAMKKEGYKTAAFGKWHLGDDPEYRPNARGFDYFYGFLAGGRSYFPHPKQDIEGEVHSIRINDDFSTFEGYLTDQLCKNASNWITKNKENPFFIYWAPNAVHTPMEATKEDLLRFKDHPRQTLAAMTWALDRAVGDMVNTLENERILDNTIIFFLSDNGGAHNNQSSNKPLKGFKGNKFEGGHRVPFFVHYPAVLKGGVKFEGLTSSLDIFATALAAAGGKQDNLDGVDLLPFLLGKKQGDPHNKLFWRKGNMAAARMGDYKLIRVKTLGNRLYNLKDNLRETINLIPSDSINFNKLSNNLQLWEQKLIKPLWTEGELWDTITTMIHEDYFKNRAVRVKNPLQLKKWKESIQ